MKLINALSLSICFTLTLYSNNTLAGSCSKNDIDHYLKSGFTHDQVVKLCETPVARPAVNTPYQAPVATTPATAQPYNALAPTSQDANQLYFETVINANPVTLSGDSLIFERKECATYGDIDMTQTRDKACVKTRTTIQLKDLQIIRAQKAILMVRKQELVVKGTITREYLDLAKHNKYKIAAIQQQLPAHPEELNIPVKKGIDPTRVVTKLKAYH
ncbi:MAG TPA: hypothetical protein ENJ33_08390 [Thiothrix sp.]|nr:hypothetical protein [Thiothrix sp.]